MIKNRLFDAASIVIPLIIFSFSARPALGGEGVIGKVDFIATGGETIDNGYHATFPLRITGKCGSRSVQNLTINVRSGRMDGQYAHNSANFRNAYNTAITALLTDKTVQLGPVDKCSNGAPLDLWGGGLGMYQ
jgi:hypothetical protein